MFIPNYKNLQNAAWNRKSERIPLYEHIISPLFIEKATGIKFAHLMEGNYEDKCRFFEIYSNWEKDMGYDTVSWEECICPILPGGGALGNHVPGAIQCREDFEKYPWDELHDRYFEAYDERFCALRETMPAGMRAHGGVGNGVFEIVQDLVGYENLCYMRADDEDLYADMFHKVGEVMYSIWSTFLERYSDIYCVCRFGDDLGFRSNTLLPADDIRQLVIPQYARIVKLVHEKGLPFLLHSCGCIFSVMDDIIDVAKIDAKHSNEDAICDYSRWLDDYGDRIGNFGGLDTDALCDLNPCDIESYTERVVRLVQKKGHGVALGSGNSIPDYVSVERYMKANRVMRRMRGEDI